MSVIRIQDCLVSHIDRGGVTSTMQVAWRQPAIQRRRAEKSSKRIKQAELFDLEAKLPALWLADKPSASRVAAVLVEWRQEKIVGRRGR